ncbi:hypothetical protein CQA57_06620 [Helicobacter anseris]|uniref:Uncharacterized protein n=1 Tax=Helicobacter anseris TaxID=375926 RepID=A0A3D8J6W6_9HELI|nr:hypothetical protein [Helicobacter anseris]RDU72634.1 hypothetical protein CQA57_06620 [Helicobacter anseris]
MRLFLKFIFASTIGLMWYRISGDDSAMAIALTLFIFVLSVLVMRPIEFQSPEKREEYIQKMREKKERRQMIEAKQKEELARMKKINKIKEDQRLAEYKKKFDSRDW